MPDPNPEDPRSGDPRRTVLLVGMMGSGKTTVGGLIAERLGARFADTDDRVATETGMTIPEIFDTGGEASFRAAESEALAHLLSVASTREMQVVATGGGVVLDAENLELMKRFSTVVWLRTGLDTLAQRIGSGDGRPLLDVEGSDRYRRGRLSQIATDRAGLYEKAADFVVDTDGLSAESVADAVLEAVSAAGIR